jgi:hypothetical protein
MTVTGLKAQNALADRALNAYQENDYKTAMTLIDSAILIPAEAGSAYVWHLRGFIYKDYYKQIEKEDRLSTARPTAVESFLKSRELDASEEFLSLNNNNLKYLCITFFNDAVRLLDTTNYVISEKYYLDYKRNMLRAFPDTDFKKNDVDYYNVFAQILTRKYNPADVRSEEFFNMAIRVYENVIAIDSNNCTAHYQIAILYYNRGVDILLNLPDETDLEDIIKAQDLCLGLFLKSKPHMHKAWELTNCVGLKRIEIAEGLSGIYYQLNEPDKFKYWDEKRKRLQEED